MPYNRLLRWEVFRSERFLSLPSDTHRVVFVALLTEADDFGNVEGGPRRLWRWMHCFAQVKLEQDAIRLMSELNDADLARRYEVDGKEFWHLPRFRNDRTWQTRLMPCSPWCNAEAPTGKGRFSNRSEFRTVRRKPDTDLTQDSHRAHGALTIGVGVGVGSVFRSVVDIKDRSTSCSEPKRAQSIQLGEGPVIETIPLVGDAEASVCESHLKELERLYPGVEPMATLREIRGWNLSHPSRRKTAKGIAAHINSWFQKDQNRG